MSDILQMAAQKYSDICKFQYCFTLSNGEQILVVFKPQNFVHLAGLRKLNDLDEFQDKHRSINIYKRILAGEIGIYDAQRSVHYDFDARTRIENLARLDYLLNTDRVVWDFDKDKAPLRTRLKSTVLFFRDDGFEFYLLLGVAQDGVYYYPETFFLRYDDAYIRGQNIVYVDKLEVVPYTLPSKT